MISEKPCRNHSIEHANPSELFDYYGATYTVQCDEGFIFPNQTNVSGTYLHVERSYQEYVPDSILFRPDFQSSVEVTCMENFKWNFSETECISKYHVLMNIVYSRLFMNRICEMLK